MAKKMSSSKPSFQLPRDAIDPKPYNPPAPPAASAKPAGPRGYKVVVSGEYYAHAPEGASGNVIRRYKETVNVPDLVNPNPLSLLKKKILPILLPKKHQDFNRLRTYYIESTEPLGSSPRTSDPKMMNTSELNQYVEANNLPVNLHHYDTIQKQREMVILSKTDPKGFEFQSKRDAKDHSLTEILRDLNPGLKVEIG